ncbi:DnaJ family domain-containing protein [Qingshengfaniella alkalisoli]|uniref:DUF1992 domain-containing protein n=1 Tax=Qingshengfaniella alkalisoli TaxID=2599296 RepID=A0A5B8J108_9RHOB|nr:DnaJ family domain-containing protein [Qingshengfaniella alkalisoli]QDY71453.1 DUF1992 domain-containing protein [Qingshengfaniella alkalisoli]
MSHPLNSVIDEAMRKAEAEGAFDNLPGAGQPLRNLHDPKDALLDRAMTESRLNRLSWA